MGAPTAEQGDPCVSTRVLPEPAPARISSGPSPCTTASRCGFVEALQESLDAVVGGGLGHDA